MFVSADKYYDMIQEFDFGKLFMMHKNNLEYPSVLPCLRRRKDEYLNIYDINKYNYDPLDTNQIYALKRISNLYQESRNGFAQMSAWEEFLIYDEDDNLPSYGAWVNSMDSMVRLSNLLLDILDKEFECDGYIINYKLDIENIISLDEYWCKMYNIYVIYGDGKKLTVTDPKVVGCEEITTRAVSLEAAMEMVSYDVDQDSIKGGVGKGFIKHVLPYGVESKDYGKRFRINFIAYQATDLYFYNIAPYIINGYRRWIFGMDNELAVFSDIQNVILGYYIGLYLKGDRKLCRLNRVNIIDGNDEVLKLLRDSKDFDVFQENQPAYKDISYLTGVLRDFDNFKKHYDVDMSKMIKYRQMRPVTNSLVL